MEQRIYRCQGLGTDVMAKLPGRSELLLAVAHRPVSRNPGLAGTDLGSLVGGPVPVGCICVEDKREPPPDLCLHLTAGSSQSGGQTCLCQASGQGRGGRTDA